MPRAHDDSSPRWRFGEFELSPGRGLLLRDDREVELAAKSFEILVHLVRHRDRVVPRRELVEHVWHDVVVSDAAVSSAVRDLRRALDDRGRSPAFIATRRGRGLRFVHAVEEVHDGESDGRPGGAWEAAAVHLERALEALEMVAARRAYGSRPPRERAELLVALARARWSAGASEEARKAFLEAARVARSHGDAEILAYAALGFVGRTDVTPGVNRRAVALLEEALDALSELDSPVRAELLARLGTELYYEDVRASDRLTQEALAMAERTGDEPVVAYAVTARHFALQRPEVDPKERLPLSDRVFALVGRSLASDVCAFALQQRIVDLMELGDGEAFEAACKRFEDVAEELDQPFFHWVVSIYRGTRALLAGRVAEAERLAAETLDFGQRFALSNAEGVFAAQIFSVRRAQGRVAELIPALEAVAAQYPALPIFRAGLAAALVEADAGQRAAAALEAVMASDLDEFPRDQNWVATLGTLAPAVAAAGSDARRRQMLDLLSPYAERMIVVGQGATTHGAVSHHLGLLHASLGEDAAAETWLARAEMQHERAGAMLWAAESRLALSR